MVVMFAISLQCTVLSSFLSALHEVEHAGELFDAHSFAHDHHHGGEDGHHHPGIHHPDSDASSGSRLTLDGHSHGADPNHVSGEHGFFHFSGAPVLFDQDEDPFRLGEPLPAATPLAFCPSGLPCVRPGAPHRPPIA